MTSKSLKDLEASFSVLVSNVKNYYSGNKHAYLPVAVELRKLLCDTQRGKDKSLLKRVFPHLRLKPLQGSQNKFDEYTVFYIPGRLASDGNGVSKVWQLINENAASITIDEWLAQKFIDSATTIKDFIRSVADKEGAHSDEEFNVALRKTKSFMIPGSWSLCDQYIVFFGRYLTKTLAIWMLNDDLKKISEYIRSQSDRFGRGCAIIDLHEFGLHISEGVPVSYATYEGVASMLSGNPDNCKTVLKSINTYDISNNFLLFIKDINTEIWGYQQRMSIT